jgi:hypothetical protein
MSCNTNLSDINQTFIVEAIITTDAYSGACDGVHTNELLSCDVTQQYIYQLVRQF